VKDAPSCEDSPRLPRWAVLHAGSVRGELDSLTRLPAPPEQDGFRFTPGLAFRVSDGGTERITRFRIRGIAVALHWFNDGIVAIHKPDVLLPGSSRLDARH